MGVGLGSCTLEFPLDNQAHPGPLELEAAQDQLSTFAKCDVAAKNLTFHKKESPMSSSGWWFQPIWKICKYARQIGSFPQTFGVKIPKMIETTA